jgi:hypothetical protein
MGFVRGYTRTLLGPYAEGAKIMRQAGR